MLKFMEFLKMFPFCSFVPATSPPVYSSEGCQNNPFLSKQLTAQSDKPKCDFSIIAFISSEIESYEQ